MLNDERDFVTLSEFAERNNHKRQTAKRLLLAVDKRLVIQLVPNGHYYVNLNLLRSTAENAQLRQRIDQLESEIDELRKQIGLLRV